MHRTSILVPLLLLVGMSACWRKPKPEPLLPSPQPAMESAEISAWRPVSVRRHPGFGRNIAAWGTWESHLKRTYELLQFSYNMPKSKVDPAWSRDQLLETIELLLKASQGNERDFWANLERDFVVLRAISEEYNPAFFTGYYCPIFRGSKTPTAVFNTPIYAAPSDLNERSEHYTRMAIDRGGALKGKGLEICYLESPLDAFLLHVQGSATINTPDGGKIGLGYGGSNGLAYQSLGKMMIDRGMATARNMSLQTIVNAYHRDRKTMEDLMMLNERYIFFQESDGLPRGSTGAVVEGFHTLATERDGDGTYRFLPHQPALVTLSMPGMGTTTLMTLCQDTGSAIKGAVRADIYIGEGKVAERMAGKLKHRGELYLLWPKFIPYPKTVGGIPVEDAGLLAAP